MDGLLTAFQTENPHLEVRAMIEVENGAMYFDSQTKAIVDRLFRRYDHSVPGPERSNLDHEGDVLAKCTICRHSFYSIQIFDEHNVIFHTREVKWPIGSKFIMTIDTVRIIHTQNIVYYVHAWWMKVD